MAYERKDYAGGAADTTLNGDISNSATSITIVGSTGWPSGANGPFAIVIDAGTAAEEKVLIQSRTSTTLTVATGGRGYDGTTAAAHSNGASVKHCMTATDFDEANYWVAELATAATAANDLIIADADNSLSRIAKGSNSRVLAVDSGGSLGYTTVTSAMITDGTIVAGDIADGAITSAKILDGTIVAGDLADGAVTSAKILDGTISTGDIADSAITSAKIADGTIVAGDLADDAVTTAKIASGAVTSAKIADATIVAGDLADSAVETGKIANNAVTQAKVASGYRLTFAGASAPSSPSEGDLWWDTDDDLLSIYSGTAWEHVVRPGGWQDWEPALGGTGAGIGTGTVAGRFQKVGRTVNFQIVLVGGSNTNLSSTALTLTLPPGYPARDPGNVRAPIGLWVLFDPGVFTYSGATIIDHETSTSNDRIHLLYGNTFVSDANPIEGGFTTGDELVINGTYESTA